jgi:cation:H+ antiporter
MLALDLIIFIAACLLVFVSGSILVRTLETITAFLRMTEFAVGFIIVGISTSLPELFVGITAAVNKNPALALGTVIGSNIVDLTLVAGITIIFAKHIEAEYKVISKDTWIMVGAAAAPMLLMLGTGVLSRIDGVILLALFLLYSRWLIKKGRAFKKELKETVKRYTIVISSFLFVISLVLLYFSSTLVVEYGSKLAIGLMLPAIFVGIFFVAFGTSVPELVFGLISVKKGHPEFVIGNVVGSVVANSLLVLGITAIIYPITANLFLLVTSAMFMIVVCFLFATFIAGKRLTWQEGVVLIMLYVLFLIVELNLKGFF